MSMDTILNQQLFYSFWTRWLVIIGIGLLNLGGQLIELTFAPIVYESSEFLSVSTNQITLLASIGFPIVFVFGILAMWAIDKYGLYWPVVGGGWFLLIGSMIRVIGVCYESYGTVLAGQIIGYRKRQ